MFAHNFAGAQSNPPKRKSRFGAQLPLAAVPPPPPPPPPLPPPPPVHPATQSSVWPDSLVNYVQRALSSAHTPSDRQFVEEHLKRRIEDAMRRNLLEVTNWAAEPLPLSVSLFIPIPSDVRPQAQPFQSYTDLTSLDRPPPRPTPNYGRPKRRAKRARLQVTKALGDYANAVEIDYANLRIVGTSTSLEKPYLRLTQPPDPSTVRPQPVLENSLEMLLSKWKDSTDYVHTCEQFKSIRQDMTVQHIRNLFTVQVYESHARIALEVGDLSEYNQCQTRLMDLYQESESFRANYLEFLSYQILYNLVINNIPALNKMLGKLNNDARNHPLISYALNIRRAVALVNYAKFFKLLSGTSHRASLLVLKLVPPMRLKALSVLCRAYRPQKVDILFLVSTLGFAAVAECIDYVRSCGGVITDGELQTAQSVITAPAALDTRTSSHRGITHAIA